MMIDDLTHTERSSLYIEKVLSDEISACKWVKLACQRQLNDLKRSESPDYPYYFDEKAANKAAKFMEKHRHVKSIWARKRIKLELWQSFIITTLFGWKRKSNNMRRFREAYLRIPRKNGKSIIAALIGLYMFTADNEPGAEIYCGATTEKQAWEVFRPAKIMTKNDEEFKAYYDITVNAGNLIREEDDSKFLPIVGDPGDGPSPHCGIVDEYHEHKTSDQHDALLTGMGARMQPLLLKITTAGVDLSSPCYDEDVNAQNILHGLEGFENEEYFAIIYTIDKEDDPLEFSCWHKANPNYGVSVFEDFLIARHKEAKQRKNRRNIIYTKHLNLWMNAGNSYFDMLDWNKCANKSLKIEDLSGKNCWIGVDLASKTDIADVCILFNENNKYQLFNLHFIPESAATLEEKPHYHRWDQEGWLIKTPGNMIDIDAIEAAVDEHFKKFNIIALGYDQYNAAQFAAHLQNKGVNVIQVPQTTPYLSEPTKTLEALMKAAKIEHPGDPVMTWMISNVMAKPDKKDNVFPYKAKEENKIDGAIAAINALGRALVVEPAKKKSVYETRGIRVIGGNNDAGQAALQG